MDAIADPDLRIPTTIARIGGSLYAVNARFDVPPTPSTEYEIVRVDGKLGSRPMSPVTGGG